MANKKKIATAAAAVTTAAVLALGGTFAWQSISQTALNEASDIVNPGGRLHDDFDGSNKDIYVENFTDPDNGGEDIYARIRLEEYFEVVMNYGTDAAKTETLVGSTQEVADDSGNIAYDKDGNVLYERVYATYQFDGNENEDGTYKAAVDEDGTGWWTWTVGGEDSETVYYMPTFNRNKDSLVADINGVYEDAVGGISDRDGSQYTDYTAYDADSIKTAYEIYDGDVNSLDELTAVKVADIVENGENSEHYDEDAIVLVEDATHQAETVGATNGLISMADWLALGDDDDKDNYWVYDEDGWVYWSSPIKAGETTGLLLDGIELSQVMDDTWYYAINVVAQFVTADDVGKTDGTGFYDTSAGTVPSASAESLLSAIGVIIPETTADSDNSEGDKTAPTITAVQDTDYGITTTVTISSISDEDYPLTVTFYELVNAEDEYPEEPFDTVTISKVNGEITAVAESESNIDLSAEDGTIEFDYNAGTVNNFGYYIGIKISDTSGNTVEIEEPLWLKTMSGCFAAGTQVQTEDGLVNVEDIQVGDKVYSIDLDTCEKVLSTVTWVQETRYIDATYTISAGDQEIVVTCEHPFYVFDSLMM